jgi:hypothetical protein
MERLISAAETITDGPGSLAIQDIAALTLARDLRDLRLA